MVIRKALFVLELMLKIMPINRVAIDNFIHSGCCDRCIYNQHFHNDNTKFTMKKTVIVIIWLYLLIFILSRPFSKGTVKYQKKNFQISNTDQLRLTT